MIKNETQNGQKNKECDANALPTEFTFISNFLEKKINNLQKVTLPEIVEIYNEKDDTKFMNSLAKLGYSKSLKELNKWAHRSRTTQKWKDFIRFPFLLAFLLTDVYNEDFPNWINLIDISNASKSSLKRSDFNGISTMPESVFETLIAKNKKGIYGIVKNLLPSITFVTYNENTEGKTIANISAHSGYIGLDIDLQIANLELFEIITKCLGTSIYTVLYSPSGTLRPILRVDFGDDVLKEFQSWHNTSICGLSFEQVKPQLMNDYSALIFKKLEAILGEEYFMSDGHLRPLELDKVTFNVNRIFYLARNKEKHLEINENATPVTLTRKECRKYGGIRFAQYSDIFGGL